ncbi:hypothetical protein NDU88_003268 [Pleurodeles waltl]|uniref:Uncharacterized protein n=1 Tax=Pleurodeles waltl TaxID=8319 RepID=A0AAV7LF27_PLEWA|nr:hypothetical protein NDU88_003268 [Pleurodeles waltl]
MICAPGVSCRVDTGQDGDRVSRSYCALLSRPPSTSDCPPLDSNAPHTSAMICAPGVRCRVDMSWQLLQTGFPQPWCFVCFSSRPVVIALHCFSTFIWRDATQMLGRGSKAAPSGSAVRQERARDSGGAGEPRRREQARGHQESIQQVAKTCTEFAVRTGEFEPRIPKLEDDAVAQGESRDSLKAQMEDTHGS